MPNESSIRIEAAQPADAPAIASVHAESWQINYRGSLADSYLDGDVVRERLDVWQKRLSSPPDGQLVLVARRQQRDQSIAQGSILGFGCAYFREDQQWGTLLDNLHVVPDAQRHGIGAALLTAVARWSHARDPRVGLYLWVLEQNQKARRFYLGLEAQDVGGDVWNPPGGGSVARRRYAWRDLARLATASSDDHLTSVPSSSGW